MYDQAVRERDEAGAERNIARRAAEALDHMREVAEAERDEARAERDEWIGAHNGLEIQLAETRAEVERLRGGVVHCAHLTATMAEAWRHLNLDTPEDQELHTMVVEATDAAASTLLRFVMGEDEALDVVRGWKLTANADASAPGPVDATATNPPPDPSLR
jgi:hypothetical protein